MTRPRGGECGGRGRLVPPPRGSRAPGGPQGATTHARCLWARPQHVLGAAHRRSSLRRDPGPARLRRALPGTGVCLSCGAGLLSGHALRSGSEGPVRSPARAKATSQKPSSLTQKPSPRRSAGSRAQKPQASGGSSSRGGGAPGRSGHAPPLTGLANRSCSPCRVRRLIFQSTSAAVARATAS